MKKKIGILAAIIIMIGIPLGVKAAETYGSSVSNMKSHGNIFYEDANGSVKIYAEDIVLLQEKLASVPDEIFDPNLYSHVHAWEYLDITDEGHKKHCPICGSKYDIVDSHNETEVRECSISFDGEDYPGYERICECGYSRTTEMIHSPIYTQKNETYHSVVCALENTPYCEGMENHEERHTITLTPTDETHHQEICYACQYEGDVEECVFDLDEMPAVNARITEVKKYCICGNYSMKPVTEPEPEPEQPEATEETTILDPSDTTTLEKDLEGAETTTEETEDAEGEEESETENETDAEENPEAIEDTEKPVEMEQPETTEESEGKAQKKNVDQKQVTVSEKGGTL